MSPEHWLTLLSAICGALSPEHWLNLLSAICGALGVAVTAWDVLPEYRLSKARGLVEIARSRIERAYFDAQTKPSVRSQMSPSELGLPLLNQYAREISRVVRLGGWADDQASEVNKALDRAADWLRDPRELTRWRFAFIVMTSGPTTTPAQMRAMIEDLHPEVRRFFDFEGRLENLELRTARRRRPPLRIGIALLIAGFAFQALVSFIPAPLS